MFSHAVLGLDYRLQNLTDKTTPYRSYEAKYLVARFEMMAALVPCSPDYAVWPFRSLVLLLQNLSRFDYGIGLWFGVELSLYLQVSYWFFRCADYLYELTLEGMVAFCRFIDYDGDAFWAYCTRWRRSLRRIPRRHFWVIFMAAKRKRDIINSSFLVSSTTELGTDLSITSDCFRSSSSPLNLSKMSRDNKEHPVLSPTAIIAERYRNLSLKSPLTMSIREEEDQEKMPSPTSMKRPKSESDNWSDCGR